MSSDRRQETCDAIQRHPNEHKPLEKIFLVLHLAPSEATSDGGDNNPIDICKEARKLLISFL